MEKLMNQINSVCVYSASSTKIDPVYFTAAETLGRLLADHHIRLINGAGSIGLMRSVADAVLANGGEAAGGNVDGLLPISVQLYAGFADAFAHAATSDAGMEVGKSVICALL